MRYRTVIVTFLLLWPGLCTAQRNPVKCTRMDQVMTWLGLYRKSKNTYPQAQLIAKIKDEGFCARPTEAEFEAIRKAEGSPELLTAIDEATRPAGNNVFGPKPQPTPPPPPKEGKLHVVCEPVDCQVSVNGKILGPSSKGQFLVTQPVGLATVAVTVEDYEADPRQQNIDIKGNETASASFKLTVSKAALQRAGERLFARMLQALGGEEGLKALGFFKANGTFECYDKAGKQSVWEVSTLVKSPDKAFFDLSRAGNKSKYQAANTDRGMEWSKTEKGDQFADLDLSLRRFQEQQIAQTVGMLRRGGFKMTTTQLTPNPGEDPFFFADDGSHVYRIRLDSAMRPREIVLQSGGLDRGLKVQYSDYVEGGGSAYPRNLEIQYPDADRHGITAKLKTVDLNPQNVKDADFKLKKKGKFLGVL